MVQAMEGGITDKGTPSDDTPKVIVSMNETFQRIESRVVDILSSIEDTLRTVEPSIDANLDKSLKILSTRLIKEAGLGVFAQKAVNIVKEEMRGSLTAEVLFASVYESLEDSRESVRDIIGRAGKGVVRRAGKSSRELQSRLVMLHANLTDRENQLELAKGEIRKLRQKATEIEELSRSKDKEKERILEELHSKNDVIQNLEVLVEERANAISVLKGDLSAVQAQIDQQKQLIEKLGSAEEFVSDYESKIEELSQTQGRLAETLEILNQAEDSTGSLRQEVKSLKDGKSQHDAITRSLNEEIAYLKGAKESYEVERDSLTAEIAELKARWDMLYQVAEDEPAFRAYFVVADKTHWFPLRHLSSALGIPTKRLNTELQRFIEIGLIEIEDDKVRPRNLTEVAKKVAGQTTDTEEAAKAELGESEDSETPTKNESTAEESDSNESNE